MDRPAVQFARSPGIPGYGENQIGCYFISGFRLQQEAPRIVTADDVDPLISSQLSILMVSLRFFGRLFFV